ncbi:MAG: class I SAM-dependent methyltransferase [Elusimicrobiota bacterium]|nr:class I SAM-dependent methyltransferase [Elusimicrobiota bacterium]
MNSRPPLDAFFPLRYDRRAWVSGALLTGGFIALEVLLHAQHSPMPGEESVWEAVYALGYAVYLAPLALSATRAEPGAIRRMFMGFAALLTAGAFLALPPWERFGLEAAPCLQIAGMSMVFLFCLRRRLYAAAAASLALTVSTFTAMMMTGLHAMTDSLVGVGLGWAAAQFSDWRDLAFLQRDDPWAAMRHEFGELRNLFTGNRRRAWDDSYAGGHWDFLDSTDQRPRHYAIAGLLSDRLPSMGGRVLDAGCGLATLYPLLRGRASAYVGLDLSDEALKKARAAYGAEPGTSFVHAPFESFNEDGFDAVVLNEVLYYYPLAAIERVFTHAMSRLRPGGILIISMNRNLKAKLIWRGLESVAAPEQGIRVHNLRTGSYWTVKVYHRAEKQEIKS